MRDGEAPRVHPVSIGIVDGVVYVFVLPSAKLTDLLTDGRYALHAHLDPARPVEFQLRGRAREVTDQVIRQAVIGVWSFTPDDTYRLFASDIADVLLGKRDSSHEWPPRYSRWKAASDR